MTDNPELAKVIKAAFRKSGMTRAELSRRSNCAYSTVHRLFSETSYRDIGLRVAQRLCDVLDLELKPKRGKRR